MLGIVFQGTFQVPLLCTNLWLKGFGQLSSSSHLSHLPPSPSPWNDYPSYFHPHFLKSHFRAAQFTLRNTIPWGPAGHLGRQHLPGLAPGEASCSGGEGKINSTPQSHGKQLRAREAASALPVPAGDIRERGDAAWALAGLPAAPDVICLERPGWAGAASRWEKVFYPKEQNGSSLGALLG